jgi:very-long-chain (3R)-3-hydroxyacyl-CoA dehydratase
MVAQARYNPIYASMVLSWSITEIIRYSFYAANKLQSEPKWLLWLRYTTFYVLYPTGASSEAFLILSTIPFQQTIWTAWDYIRAAMFLIWWPGMCFTRCLARSNVVVLRVICDVYLYD